VQVGEPWGLPCDVFSLVVTLHEILFRKRMHGPHRPNWRKAVNEGLNPDTTDVTPLSDLLTAENKLQVNILPL
jgi:hypothetical protein